MTSTLESVLISLSRLISTINIFSFFSREGGLLGVLLHNTCWPLQELAEWNTEYHQKFGFVFLICASGRSTSEILEELKVDPFLKFIFMMMVSKILAIYS